MKKTTKKLKRPYNKNIFDGTAGSQMNTGSNWDLENTGGDYSSKGASASAETLDSRISGGVTGAIGLGTTIMDGLTPEYTKATPIEVESNEDLLSQWGKYSSEQARQKSVGTGMLSGAGSGASMGSVIGPWGTAIGAVVGGLVGMGTTLFGNRKARRKADIETQKKDSMFRGAASSLDYRQDLNSLANYAAMGGKISNGGFTNGFTQFNTGGTHEQNPNDGIQQGVDSNGTPNFVEQDETKYQDYIFSNRLKMSKGFLENVGLSTKYKDKTISDISKGLNKESEERPNDLISKNGLDANMKKLKGIQEYIKQVNAPQPQQNQFAGGGNLFKWGDDLYYGQQNVDNSILSNPFLKSSSSNIGIPLTMYIPNERKINNKIVQPRTNYSTLLNQTLVPDYSAPTLQSTDKSVFIDPESIGKSISNMDPESQLPQQKDANYPTWMRYAGVAGSGLSAIGSMFSKPNYSASKAVAGMSINPQLLGDYMGYTPMDRNYYINSLNANAAATRRSLADISGGNRGNMAANVLSADRSYGNSLGDLAVKAEQYNLAQRQQQAEFNRGTNEFNAQAQNAAQVQNNQYKMTAAELRANAKMQNSQTRAKNIGDFINNISAVGRENMNFNMVKGNKGLYYYTDKKTGKQIYKEPVSIGDDGIAVDKDGNKLIKKD